MYELMSLFEEALVHYDELEAGFFQTLTGKRSSKLKEARTSFALVS